MQKINVVAALIKKNEKVLIAKRKRKLVLGGLWEFPGGIIENNESEVNALHREMYEEFNVFIEIKKLFYKQELVLENKLFTMITYEVEFLSNKIKLFDHDEVKEISIKEFHKYDFPAPDHKVIWNLQN